MLSEPMLKKATATDGRILRDRALSCFGVRLAISNNRLLELSEGKVTFSWKDYRHESKNKTMRLNAQEFMRRFLLHVLPSGFQRIRNYGFLANRYRQVKIALCRKVLGAPVPAVDSPDQVLDYRDHYQRLTGLSLRDCPHCGKGQMVGIESFPAGVLPRGPPSNRS